MNQVVIRLDDVRGLSDRLARVWNVLDSHGVPVHLEVIPVDLDAGDAARLNQRAQQSPGPVAAHQHGYRHINHGSGKKRFEFGNERDISQQRHDILAGREILERRLGELFEPIFTPPWDRIGISALEILAEECYLAVSVIETSTAPEHSALPRVPMTIDPVRWRPTPIHHPWDGTYRKVEEHLVQRGYAGIELHHEVMVDDEDIAGLDHLLSRLRGVEWPTMRSVAERLASGPA